ncbi:adenosylcobinamide-phosphate synthase CbiB [Flammeovirga sp. SJP92]|uniref:adenosylcobinamide-phosphate synthase CbiB n=1 Tax=Flammeovirga sp. SJP92 TaxID=1775430 RepID=UPI000787E8D2|nr:adenosylcobinamide-phosphate synthase CbiB [Flammeovirga sp. SJP92]KXX68400.1 cobalamin biosynthesis protein CobD [Flammeovirga sp. SJP92]
MGLESVVILSVAFLLDLIFGDPRSLPHLIVGYGNLISFGEKRLNKGKNKLIKGALLTIILVSSSFAVSYYILCLIHSYNAITASVISIILLFYCLANKTLVKEGIAVFNALEKDGLEAGRKRLSWIVGRDTSELSAQQIRTATLETMSENLSDGVIAPLFYFAIFGVPGAMAYKMINTFDSMIGYKNERYEKFGKFAAKLDDAANYIPARLTALLMLIVTFRLGGLFTVFSEGKKHSSPNAGYPEAALAYILNVRFGGPNFYGGKLVDKPYIGHNDRNIQHHEIHKVGNINYATSWLFVLSIVSILVLIQFL